MASIAMVALLLLSCSKESTTSMSLTREDIDGAELAYLMGENVFKYRYRGPEAQMSVQIHTTDYIADGQIIQERTRGGGGAMLRSGDALFLWIPHLNSDSKLIFAMNGMRSQSDLPHVKLPENQTSRSHRSFGDLALDPGSKAICFIQSVDDSVGLGLPSHAEFRKFPVPVVRVWEISITEEASP
jgi:hypothetical protein